MEDRETSRVPRETQSVWGVLELVFRPLATRLIVCVYESEVALWSLAPPTPDATRKEVHHR